MQPSGKTKTAYCLSTLRIQQYHPNHSSIEKKGMTQNSNAGRTATEAVLPTGLLILRGGGKSNIRALHLEDDEHLEDELNG